MLAPSNRTVGGVASPAVLPLASEPAPANKSLVNKPAIAPAGTPVAPAAPLPLASAPSVPSTPPGGATAGQGINESAPKAAPTGDATAGQGGERSAPAGPAVPTPYQTNDPLAFAPPMTDTGYTQAPTPPVTETASGLLPPTATPQVTPPAPQVLDIGSLFGGSTPTAGTPTAPTPTAATSSNGAVSLTPTTPDSALTNYTISPGALADRFGIAKDKIADWNAIEEPIFDRTIQSISQNRAGAGQLGSGMVRGAFRDAAGDYDTRRLTAERGFLNDALGGSIDDAFKSVGVAQQQQQQQQSQQAQGFNQNVTLQQMQDSEQGQQWTQLMQSIGFNADQMQKAFENAMSAQKLSDDETGQAFSRAMQQAIFGASGDPAQFLEWLSGQYALPQGFTGTAG